MRWLVGTVFVLAAATVVADLHVGLALGLCVAVAAWALVRWTIARRARGVRLRVEHGTLLLPRSRSVPPIRVPLDELANVEMAHKSIRRLVLEQPVGAPMITTTLSPSVEVARVVFLFGDGPRSANLTETYASHSHTVECLRRIRVFLRAHGWLPRDERNPAGA
jgi:hypothetical protein